MGKRIEYVTGRSISGAMYVKDVEPLMFNGKAHRQALFLCCCGGLFIRSIGNVRSSKFATCGCYRRLILSVSKTQHGLSGHKIHRVWSGMIERCYNPDSDGFKNYGARGIGVYVPWRDDVVLFKEYVESLPGYDESLLGRYANQLTIDRIDNDGNYEPGNLRWATKLEQSRNRRSYSRPSSGYVGVLWLEKRGKWLAYVREAGAKRFVCYANTKKEAVLRRRDYIIEHELTDQVIQEWKG